VKSALALEKAANEAMDAKRRKAECKEQASVKDLNEFKRSSNDEERRRGLIHRDEKRRLLEQIQAAEEIRDKHEQKSKAAAERFRKAETGMVVIVVCATRKNFGLLCLNALFRMSSEICHSNPSSDLNIPKSRHVVVGHVLFLFQTSLRRWKLNSSLWRS
jgi:hypothetical protein